MRFSTIIFTAFALVASLLLMGCDKAPDGVIKESDMVHVIADFAKAEAIIEQSPSQFPDDSSKLALKQSILKKYDADLAKYDSSLVWYAHNLKIYSEVSEKAIKMLEKEANIKHSDNSPGSMASAPSPASTPHGVPGPNQKRVFATTGDSANLWKEPPQWMLTSALKNNGLITWDYKPDAESRKGDVYALNLKVLAATGGSSRVMLAIDYNDGATSYISRNLGSTGWTTFTLQADTTRIVKRIYGFISCDTRTHNVTLLDSIYLLRTHFDPSRYSMIAVQRIAGPKAAVAKKEQQHDSGLAGNPAPGNNSLPGMPSMGLRPNIPATQEPNGPKPGRHVPKPGLNKSVIPSRERITNPNGDHVPHPPIK